MEQQKDTGIGRREFVSTAAAAATITILKPSLVFGTQANSAVRLGLLGSGGRGLVVASSFLKHTGAVVTAVGDLFADRLEIGKKRLDTVAADNSKPAVPDANYFKGPKAYESVFGSKDVDAVIIATPVFLHPAHCEAALAAGKHVYLEKPVAVDVPGCKKVVDLGPIATAKKLSLAIGLQLRHASPYVELARRMHEGECGSIVCGQIHYFASALNRPEWPDNERRMRNWVHDKVLSGDTIVEQNVHIIDMTNWLLKARPIKAVGTCGRAGRTDKGDASSHFNVVYTYPGDVHLSLASTQFGKSGWGVEMQYYGTKGSAQARYDAPVRISGETKWEFPGLGKPPETEQAAAATGAFRGALEDADANKEKAFIDSITNATPLNEVGFASESTLSGILGRTAAYSGKEVTWDELLNSKDAWDPKMDLTQFS